MEAKVVALEIGPGAYVTEDGMVSVDVPAVRKALADAKLTPKEDMRGDATDEDVATGTALAVARMLHGERAGVVKLWRCDKCPLWHAQVRE